MSIKELRRVFGRASAKAWNDSLIPATLGKAEGSGQYTLEVDGKHPAWNYVTLSDRTIAQAINVSAGRLPRMPVWLDRDPAGVLYVVGVNLTQALQFLGDQAPSMGVGQHSHEIGFGYDDPVSTRRISVGLVQVSSGMTVYVRPFLYEYNGVVYAFSGGFLDLTAEIPASASTKVMCIVWFDPVTQVLGATSGDEVSVLSLFTLTDVAAVPLSGDVYPLRGVTLREGQTAITEEKDFVDARLWLGRQWNTIRADFLLKAATILTLSGGAVTTTQGQHILAAETGTTDDLDTINGLAAGQFYLVRADAGDTITVKHGTGNIELNGEADFALSGNKCLLLFSPDGATAVDVGIGGGGGGASTALDNLNDPTAINQSLLFDSDALYSIGSSSARALEGWIQTVLGDVFVRRVTNSSGGSVSLGTAGYLDSNNEFKTTTTASLQANWCIVYSGGVNGADIYVATRGRLLVNYAGSAPSAGDYLVTSTTAGSAAGQSYISPEIFARCDAAGSGGSVAVTLLTGRTLYPLTAANNLIKITSASDLDFIATINGTPGGATVVYNAPSSGAESAIDPAGSGNLMKFVLYNTTRGDSALISDVNTGTNTITLTASAPGAWANGDTLSIRSQTNTDTFGSASKFMDLELEDTAVVPDNAVAISGATGISDTGGSATMAYHPFEAGESSKRLFFQTSGASLSVNTADFTLPLIQRRIQWTWDATGSGTFTATLRLRGIILATP
jgi:hypothetical protein